MLELKNNDVIPVNTELKMFEIFFIPHKYVGHFPYLSVLRNGGKHVSIFITPLKINLVGSGGIS